MVVIEHWHRRPTAYATANSPNYCITLKTDQGSGIVNALNGWFADPHDLVTAIKRMVCSAYAYLDHFFAKLR